MTDASDRKEGFKKCRSATFSIDGYSFTIGENFPLPFFPRPTSGLGKRAFRWRGGSFPSERGGWSGVGLGHRPSGSDDGTRKSRAWPGSRAWCCPRGVPPAAVTRHPAVSESHLSERLDFLPASLVTQVARKSGTEAELKRWKYKCRERGISDRKAATE